MAGSARAQPHGSLFIHTPSPLFARAPLFAALPLLPPAPPPSLLRAQETAKTWDLCVDMIGPSLMGIAYGLGADFVAFVQAFRAMKEGFEVGAFRYSILIAEKPFAEQIL